LAGYDEARVDERRGPADRQPIADDPLLDRGTLWTLALLAGLAAVGLHRRWAG
jgi:hypothetical protein